MGNAGKKHTLTLESILKLPKLQGAQNTLILNLGFGKCGSTSLQAKILPFLPLNNYIYGGKYYKNILNSSKETIKIKPHKVPGSPFDYINEPDALIAKLNSIFTGQINRVACLSSELLPTNTDEALKLIQLIKEKLNGLKIVYLFSVRSIEPMVQSGYSHQCLQHLCVKGKDYSINDVIFETLEDAIKAGFSPHNFSTPGAIKPIIVENLKLAEIIKKLKTAKDNTFIIDVNSLYTNRWLWFYFLLNISQSYKESSEISSRWVKLMGELTPINQKTEAGNIHIDEKQRTLNSLNLSRLSQINNINNEAYPSLGHYWQ